MSTVDLEVVLDAKAGVGEGPVWDTASGRLVWVDITGCEVHAFDPRMGRDACWKLPSHVGAAAPTSHPELIAVAVRDGFGLLHTSGRFVLQTPIDATDDGIRFNDGKVDPQGRFWAGQATYDNSARGRLFCLGPDLVARPLLNDVAMSNGLCWSEEGTTFFYVDSMTGKLDAFDMDLGQATPRLSGRHTLVSLDPDEGIPDGMTNDADGNLWLALWDGGVVRCYSPEGRLLDQIDLPVSRPTSVTFGGADGQDLYITSAAEGTDPDAEPYAGAIFRCRPGVTGNQATPYMIEAATAARVADGLAAMGNPSAASEDLAVT